MAANWSTTRKHLIAFGAIATLSLAATSVLPSGDSGSGPEVARVSIAFKTENGWIYDGRIELPPKTRRNGWAVMMLGGGMGTAIDWFVPGELSIDGKPTRDADTIAKSLLGEGFVVMRWHAIRRGDPEFAKDPLMLDPPSYAQTVEQAEKAFAEFRKLDVVPVDRTFLLGHSLGARRACIVLDENPTIPGVVMLAGARLIRTKLDAVREVVTESDSLFTKRDSDRDGRLRGHELPAINDKSLLRRFDTDQDGGLDRHEWTLVRLDQSAKQWEEPVEGVLDRDGHRWSVDILASLATPTLLIVGDLDERWRLESYVATLYLRDHVHPDFTWTVFAGIGHNLGQELAGPVTYKDFGVMTNARVGPISAEVVQATVEWLVRHAK